jgi:hypothetical protein
VTHGTQVLKMGEGGLGLEGSLAGVLERGRTRKRQCEHAGRKGGKRAGIRARAVRGKRSTYMTHMSAHAGKRTRLWMTGRW